MDLFLQSLTLAATPILLAGLGGMLTYRAGVLNVATEGIMLISAFASIVAGAESGSIIVALAAGIGAALLLSALFGLGCLVLKADVFVVGIGINLMAAGLTAFLLVRLLDRRGSYEPQEFPSLPKVNLGVLADLPVVGPLLDGQSIIVFAAVAALVWACVFVSRTRSGVYMTAAGEAPEALDAVGIGVSRVRWLSIALCGILCGLAGAQLSMAVLNSYTNDMTAGRGYIALAAVFFGGGRPLGTAAAAVLFGAAEALSNTLQVKGHSGELVLMLPYVLTVLVLAIARLRSVERISWFSRSFFSRARMASTS
jgi:simple sugar transport system permease protein